MRDSNSAETSLEEEEDVDRDATEAPTALAADHGETVALEGQEDEGINSAHATVDDWEDRSSNGASVVADPAVDLIDPIGGDEEMLYQFSKSLELLHLLHSLCINKKCAYPDLYAFVSKRRCNVLIASLRRLANLSTKLDNRYCL